MSISIHPRLLHHIIALTLYSLLICNKVIPLCHRTIYFNIYHILHHQHVIFFFKRHCVLLTISPLSHAFTCHHLDFCFDLNYTLTIYGLQRSWIFLQVLFELIFHYMFHFLIKISHSISSSIYSIIRSLI